MSFIISRNHEEILKPSSLPSNWSNVLWVDIQSARTINLFCNRCLKERQKNWIYSMRSDLAVRSGSRFINEQQYPISRRKK